MVLLQKNKKSNLNGLKDVQVNDQNQLCTHPYPQHCLSNKLAAFGGKLLIVLVVSKKSKRVQIFLLVQDIVEGEEERTCSFWVWNF